MGCISKGIYIYVVLDMKYVALDIKYVAWI